MPIQSIQSRSAEEWLASLPANVPTVLYKYSPYCGVSSQSDREVNAFLERHPKVVIYAIDVVHQRDLSSAVARMVRVPHASPQLIVLERGQALWHQSHYAITCEAIEAQLAGTFAA